MSEPSKQTGFARKMIVATLLGVVVFAGLSLYGDVSELRTNLRAFDYGMLAWALVLASGNYALRFLRWQYYLKQLDVRVPAFESALVFLSGFVMSVTPGKLGEVFKSLLLYESRGISIARTAPVVIAERLTDLMALVALTALGALSFDRGVPITIAGVLFVVLVWIALAWRPLGELGIAVLARLPVVRRVVPKIREAYESLRTMIRPVPVIFATCIAIVAWGLEVVSLYLIVSGFPGVSLGWEESTFAYSASTIAGALAMMPGGLGVTEAGMTGLLQTLGGEAMTAAVATATTMLVRLATLWWAVVVGLGALLIYRHWLRKSLNNAPESPAGEAK